MFSFSNWSVSPIGVINCVVTAVLFDLFVLDLENVANSHVDAFQIINVSL